MSVFEGMRCYETPGGGAIFRAHDHMNRLLDSCRIYRMPVRWSADDLVQACVDTVAGNDLRECYLRPVIIRTGEQMGVLPMDVPVETFVIAWKWGTYLGAEALPNGADVCVSSWRRPHPTPLRPSRKPAATTVNSQLSKMEARQTAISKGSARLVRLCRGRERREPFRLSRRRDLHRVDRAQSSCKALPRDSIMRIATDLGYESDKKQLPREFLYVADELFFTGRPPKSLHPLGSIACRSATGNRGPITRAIQASISDCEGADP